MLCGHENLIRFWHGGFGQGPPAKPARAYPDTQETLHCFGKRWDLYCGVYRQVMSLGLLAATGYESRMRNPGGGVSID